MTLNEDPDIIVWIWLACHELTSVGEDDAVFVAHVFAYLLGIFVEEATYDVHQILGAIGHSGKESLSDQREAEVQKVGV